MSEAVLEAAVTKIVDRVPRSGMQARLEAAIEDLIRACMRFPGYLGRMWIYCNRCRARRRSPGSVPSGVAAQRALKLG